jgi:hypothetical protein
MKLKDLIKENVQEAYFKMDKWMPEDSETQREWLKILKKKNVPLPTLPPSTA